MIDVIYEDNHLLVVRKPFNVPVQADSSGDEDLLSILKGYIKKKYNKPGNVYLGLVHRLDRPTEGIMVFARTSKAAKRLSSQICNHEFKKSYVAVICGKVYESGRLSDKLLKDNKTNISKVSPLGKIAILNYEFLEYKNGLSLVKIDLETGRSHQIRVQFSSRGFPLYGDYKYNTKPSGNLALFAYALEFTHPVTKERLKFSLDLPKRYPFNIFSVKL